MKQLNQQIACLMSTATWGKDPIFKNKLTNKANCGGTFLQFQTWEEEWVGPLEFVSQPDNLVSKLQANERLELKSDGLVRYS